MSFSFYFCWLSAKIISDPYLCLSQCGDTIRLVFYNLFSLFPSKVSLGPFIMHKDRVSLLSGFTSSYPRPMSCLLFFAKCIKTRSPIRIKCFVEFILRQIISLLCLVTHYTFAHFKVQSWIQSWKSMTFGIEQNCIDDFTSFRCHEFVLIWLIHLEFILDHIVGLVQDCSNSSGLAIAFTKIG